MSNITLKEVQEYLGESGLGWAKNLHQYPKEDLYIEIHLRDVGFKVERGHDEFYYNGYKTKSQRHLWYIIHNGDLLVEKGFRCYKTAIETGIKIRKRQLREALTDLSEAQKKVKYMKGIRPVKEIA